MEERNWDKREDKTEKSRADDMLPYAHWLYNIPGFGSRTIKQILLKEWTPQRLYHASIKELEQSIPHLAKKKEFTERIETSRRRWDVYGEYEMLRKKKIQITCLGHEDYPDRLSKIPDAPYALYYQGRLPKESRPCVAIIGARSCSEYGRRMAVEFGKELAMADIQIISGMARGIDGIGQCAALDAGGYSLGVMGCGVDICYPKENQDLYERLQKQGGICSEYLPGTQPRSSLFPPRNRIISGLSDSILVIEAKKKSGTLITVDMALEQGKEVYAMPGRLTEALSEGCNRLLAQGASVALSPQDIIQNLTGEIFPGRNPSFLLSDLQIDLLENLEETPQSLEIIRKRMLLNCRRDITLSELTNQLVKLSLDGLVRQIGSSYFMKI